MNALEVVSAGPYNALYVAGVVMALAAALWEGRRRGWPLLPWLALLAVTLAGGVIGSKLLHFDLHPAAPGEKTILGGIVGGMFALLLVTRFLRFDRAAPDALIIAGPIGFAFGRIGCFLAGCCFGRPTELPWGTTYAAGTPPFRAQLAEGLITADAARSLAVHPTQLYEAILAVALCIGIWHTRQFLRKPGGAMIALLLGFSVGRLLIEFLRVREADLLLGMTAVQWVLATAVVGLTILLLWREGRLRTPARIATAPAARLFLVAVAALSALLVGWNWFTPLERIALGLASIPPVLLLVKLHLGGARRTFPGLAAAALLIPPIAPGTLNTSADTLSEYPYSYYTAGGGAMTGAYAETCGPLHRYTVGGASMGYTHVTGPNTRYSVRGQLFAGTDRVERGLYEDGFQPGRSESSTILGLSAMGQYDAPFLGVGLGGVVGKLVLDGDTQSLLPSASLRIGRLDRFFVEGRIFSHEPAPVPGPGLKLGAGFAIDPRGSTVRFGVSDAGVFGGANIVTRGGFEIDPFVAYGDEDVYQIGLAARQRFGFRRPGP
jgi:hypothetical protein